jgi:hypothetical protein
MNLTSRTMLSSRAAAKLALDGWLPGRRVHVSRYARAYEREGFPLFALAFLAELDGICVRYHEPEVLEVIPGSASSTVLHFDLDHSLRRESPESVADSYECEWHRRLVPIGGAFDHNMVLLMDPEGWVIGANHPGFWVMGETGIHALNSFYEDTYPTLDEWRERGFANAKLLD